MGLAERLLWLVPRRPFRLLDLGAAVVCVVSTSTPAKAGGGGTHWTTSISSAGVFSTGGLPEARLRRFSRQYDNEHSLRRSGRCEGVVGLIERPLRRRSRLLKL